MLHTQCLRSREPNIVRVWFIECSKEPDCEPSMLFFKTYKEMFQALHEFFLLVIMKSLIMLMTIDKDEVKTNFQVLMNVDPTSNCWSALADKITSILLEKGRNEAPRQRILSSPNCCI